MKELHDKRLTLKTIIKMRSFRHGAVMLSSGKLSNYYVDLKPTMMDCTALPIIAEMILEKIADLDVDLVGGLELGAVPLVSAVVAMSNTNNVPINGFIVRKQVKEHGSQKAIEGLAQDESMQGKRVVILEDVSTTGASALKAVEQCQEAGAEVVMVLSIVNRQNGANDLFEQKGINFESLYMSCEFFCRVEPTPVKQPRGLAWLVSKLLNM